MSIRIGNKPPFPVRAPATNGGQGGGGNPGIPGKTLKPEYQKPGRPRVVKTILIVDDVEDVLRGLNRVLSTLGLNVLTVDPNGAETFEQQVNNLLNSNQVDLIVMDGDLSRSSCSNNKTGMDLVASLISSGYQGLIVANSGYDNPQLMEAGADFSVEKILAFNGIKSLFV